MRGAPALRYARGLFKAAKAEGRCDELARDARAIQAAFTAAPELSAALADERVPLAKRLGGVDAVGEALGLTRDSLAAIKLMVKSGRAGLIRRAIEAAAVCVERDRGVERALLRIAELEGAERLRQEVEQALSHASSKKVVCDMVRDPSLIGGFEVRLGDMRVDASVAGMLARMREEACTDRGAQDADKAR